ncbi:MAG: DUF4168 domain-containing protein [Kiloniellaceae bacterium]
MPRRFSLLRRFAVLAMPLALAGALLPGQAARAMQGDLLQLAQANSKDNAGDFSQAQLEAYADAVLKVQEIDRAWQPKIDQAPNETEAEILTTQATDEMIGGIQAQGLSVQEYNAITQAAEADNMLYERIMTLLAQAK